MHRAQFYEPKTAAETIDLTADQIAAIEKANPCFRERHVECRRSGELLTHDTLYVGQLKGVGDAGVIAGLCGMGPAILDELPGPCFWSHCLAPCFPGIADFGAAAHPPYEEQVALRAARLGSRSCNRVRDLVRLLRDSALRNDSTQDSVGFLALPEMLRKKWVALLGRQARIAVQHI